MDSTDIGPSARCDGEKKLTLLLYGAVSDPAMLRQGFYEAEVRGLESDQRVAEVMVTNRLRDVWHMRYDGLICYFYSYTAIAALLARLRGIPAVATGGGEQVFRAMASSRQTFILRVAAFIVSGLFAKRILATSRTDFREMQRLYPFDKSRIGLSYHGVSAASLASPKNFRQERPTHSMVTICNMDTEANIRRKGLRHAIKLLAKMRRHYLGASLTVIGRTTCSESVQQFADSLNVGEVIHFAGYVSEAEKFRLLQSHRFYVQLSEYEGFGIGALEAIALGCQPLHSNVGGLRDTLADYGTIIDPEKLDGFDVTVIPAYTPPDWVEFSRHIAQFGVAERADTILNALGFGSQPDNAHIGSEKALP